MVHYMSSCQGELPKKEFNIRAVDQNGNVLLDETMATLRNGFFELWLPRNQRIELRIQGFGRTATGTIGTFNNSKTCITTFQLR